MVSFKNLKWRIPKPILYPIAVATAIAFLLSDSQDIYSPSCTAGLFNDNNNHNTCLCLIPGVSAASIQQQPLGASGAGRGPRWTWDSNFEKPAGMRQEGSAVFNVYTAEQQQRLNVDELGNVLLGPGGTQRQPVGANGSGQGPRWTWDDSFEKPAGQKREGSAVIGVYTAEQQQRLNVDELGNVLLGPGSPRASRHPAAAAALPTTGTSEEEDELTRRGRAYQNALQSSEHPAVACWKHFLDGEPVLIKDLENIYNDDGMLNLNDQFIRMWPLRKALVEAGIMNFVKNELLGKKPLLKYVKIPTAPEGHYWDIPQGKTAADVLFITAVLVNPDSITHRRRRLAHEGGLEMKVNGPYTAEKPQNYEEMVECDFQNADYSEVEKIFSEVNGGIAGFSAFVSNAGLETRDFRRRTRPDQTAVRSPGASEQPSGASEQPSGASEQPSGASEQPAGTTSWRHFVNGESVLIKNKVLSKSGPE